MMYSVRWVEQVVVVADEGKAAKVVQVQARTFRTIVYSQNGPPVDPGKWWH